MTESTRILSAVARGEAGAASEHWLLVYSELRDLAARELAPEAPGQTLQDTALVHEAYVRPVGKGDRRSRADRKHFFWAAAKAMRCLLVDNARRKKSLKRGGDLHRDDFNQDGVPAPAVCEDVLVLDEALDRLAEAEPGVAELVKPRYFAGLTSAQAAKTSGVAPRTADARGAHAREWLRDQLQGPRCA
jgi:RNA polymerase sigma factor (TIGR02999 family)